METKVQIIFYSMYGYIYKMTEAVAQGAEGVKGVRVEIFRVPELVPDEILEKSGAKKIQATFSHIPIINLDQLPHADAYIFGTPTRFGSMCAQMRNFLDQCGKLWAKNSFVGKVAGVFTGNGTQHDGQETTLVSFHHTLLHLGMIITGVPYSEKRLIETNGATSYDMSLLASVDSKHMPTENELAIARYQGKHIAEIARDLKQGRSMT